MFLSCLCATLSDAVLCASFDCDALCGSGDVAVCIMCWLCFSHALGASCCLFLAVSLLRVCFLSAIALAGGWRWCLHKMLFSGLTVSPESSASDSVRQAEFASSRPVVGIDVRLTARPGDGHAPDVYALLDSESLTCVDEDDDDISDPSSCASNSDYSDPDHDVWTDRVRDRCAHLWTSRAPHGNCGCNLCFPHRCRHCGCHHDWPPARAERKSRRYYCRDRWYYWPYLYNREPFDYYGQFESRAQRDARVAGYLQRRFDRECRHIDRRYARRLQRARGRGCGSDYEERLAARREAAVNAAEALYARNLAWEELRRNSHEIFAL